MFPLGTPIRTIRRASMSRRSAWWWRATLYITMCMSTWPSRIPIQGRNWLAALDIIESLKPKAVVAGHKRPGAADTPDTVGEAKQYIRDFDRIATETQSAQDLYNRMLALYPNHVNPGALWSSARGVKH